MKTSLGIWAFGSMATRFVPAGYKPELAKETTVDRVRHAVEEFLVEPLPHAVEAVSPQVQRDIVVTVVEIDLPLEIVAAEQGGRLLIAGSAPHSRWKSGFLPEVHVAHLHVVGWRHG